MANNNEKPLLNAYLVVGEDQLKRQAVIRRLHIRLEKMGDLSFNMDTFEGEGAQGEAIVNACQTIPFASEMRLVEVTDAGRLSKKSQEEIASYLSAPNETTVLLLVADKLAKNSRLYKAVAALGDTAIIDCTPPKKWDLAKQIRAMATKHGVTITSEGAALLLEHVGEDTLRIDSELEKLALSHTGDHPIEAEDVRRLVAHVAEIKPWEFVDTFAARNIQGTIAMLPLLTSTSPYALLRQCVSRIRELLCAKTLEAEGNATLSSLAAKVSKRDWQIKKHFEDARRFTSDELICALSSSVKTELDMKSGTDPDAAFLDWVIAVLK